MSSTEADSETSYDTEGSEISFLDEIEVENDASYAAQVDATCSSECSSDDEAVAYADDPLADAEWTETYEEEMRATEKQEQTLRERLESIVEVREW